jgi:hypothetical protein
VGGEGSEDIAGRLARLLAAGLDLDALLSLSSSLSLLVCLYLYPGAGAGLCPPCCSSRGITDFSLQPLSSSLFLRIYGFGGSEFYNPTDFCQIQSDLVDKSVKNQILLPPVFFNHVLNNIKVIEGSLNSNNTTYVVFYLSFNSLKIN